MQAQSCKFPRIRNGNGRIHESAKNIGQKREDHPCPDEEEADGEVMMKRGSSGGGGRRGGVGLDISAAGGLGRLCGWPSSRIVRVSRASGGKDRHSKVWTSKGLRDRRVRLSVNTAIQFYDLQDRLGYDQPSKAVEWLLKAAASSIAELPSINTSFPETPQQLSDEKRSSAGTEHGFDSAEVEMEAEPANFQQQQHGTLSKSACSSTSETSKGSGLSLSRSESRIKARERARERAAEKEKEKEKENESSRAGHQQQQHQNVNPISQSSSFTELLTSGINGGGGAANVSNTSNNSNNTTSPNGSVHQNTGGGGGNGGGGGTSSESNLFQKSPRQWSSTMDYFTTGLLGPPSSTRPAHHSSTGFLGQIQLGNHLQQSLASVSSSPLFSITGDHHSEIPHFSFVPDHLIPVVTTAAGGSSNNDNSGNGEYNLNFTISSSSSSGLAGLNRGTLQSNSSTPSLLPQIQRFTPIDGQSAFYISTAAPPNAAVAPMENHHHHHFLPRFDAGLQLCYGDGGRHSDHKGKGKN